MRIGINTLFLIPSEVGGTETILLETVKAIRGLNSSVRFTFFTNRENHPLFKELIRKIGNSDLCALDFCASNRVLRILREQFELPGKVGKSGVDILWSPGYTGPISVPVPHIVSIPDVQYKTHPEDMTFIARLVTHLIVQSVAKRANAILTLSGFAKSEICKYYKLSEEKIVVAHCGVNECFNHPNQPSCIDARLIHLINENKPYLLCVANSYPHKNLHTLVRAFKDLEDRIPHSLVLIGRKRLGEVKIEKAIQALKNPNRVLRIDYVQHQDLPWIYQHADVFVFPSLYEGFGLPILEAMTVGCVIIASRSASVPEIAGDSVMYFDGKSAEELTHLILDASKFDPEECERRKNLVQRRSQLFSWDHTAQVTLNAFQEVMRMASK